jgi:hypothetical protein
VCVLAAGKSCWRSHGLWWPSDGALCGWRWCPSTMQDHSSVYALSASLLSQFESADASSWTYWFMASSLDMPGWWPRGGMGWLVGRCSRRVRRQETEVNALLVCFLGIHGGATWGKTGAAWHRAHRHRTWQESGVVCMALKIGMGADASAGRAREPRTLDFVPSVPLRPSLKLYGPRLSTLDVTFGGLLVVLVVPQLLVVARVLLRAIANEPHSLLELGLHDVRVSSWRLVCPPV